MCHLARCPACEYEFPERQPHRPWLARLFGRKAEPPVAAEDALTVCKLASGERAEVISLEGGHPGRRHHLAVFGLVPGAEIRLVQRFPSYVIEIGETTLALDADVAADIVVARG
jgi:Fe2+ transport system protein FeoA